MGKTSGINQINEDIDELLVIYKGLKKLDKLKKSGKKEKSLHWYFSSFPIFANSLKNIENDKYKGNQHALSMLIVYLFMRIEQAQRMILFAVIIGKYKVDSELADEIIDDLYMSRKDFRRLYKTMAGVPIHKKTLEQGKIAENVRDKVLHGKNAFKKGEQKEGIIASFNYANLLNEQIYKNFKLRPFGNMEEFEAPKESHDKITSEWILIGMNAISRENLENKKQQNSRMKARAKPKKKS